MSEDRGVRSPREPRMFHGGYDESGLSGLSSEEFFERIFGEFTVPTFDQGTIVMERRRSRRASEMQRTRDVGVELSTPKSSKPSSSSSSSSPSGPSPSHSSRTPITVHSRLHRTSFASPQPTTPATLSTASLSTGSGSLSSATESHFTKSPQPNGKQSLTMHSIPPIRMSRSASSLGLESVSTFSSADADGDMTERLMNEHVLELKSLRDQQEREIEHARGKFSEVLAEHKATSVKELQELFGHRVSFEHTKLISMKEQLSRGIISAKGDDDGIHINKTGDRIPWFDRSTYAKLPRDWSMLLPPSHKRREKLMQERMMKAIERKQRQHQEKRHSSRPIQHQGVKMRKPGDPLRRHSITDGEKRVLGV
eukprot:TRINITY_DN517_c0_g1_i1.p1 TRINITY_DN517_c0_g1~~TRINITY_DN517_c0_g1_i1.p1  ORF type:complete len:367 (+),score=91.30 TRINITY_DN517_c0_g1_i1:79-1179(+)